MEQLKNAIKINKPNISTSSINTYLSILKNLYKKVYDDDKYDLNKFTDTTKIMNYLKDLPPNKRKTILASLVVLTNNRVYQDQMMEDIQEYKTDVAKQTMTPEQSENSLKTDDIHELYNVLKHNASIIYKKKVLDKSDLQDIQNYIIICLLGGIFIPPRRSKDYVDFKINGEILDDKDNYIYKKKLIFNSYKTSKTYARQEIDCPPELLRILKKWIKVNPTHYLLFDNNLNKLSNVKLTQRLNKLFNKNASVNQLRHMYLSDKYQSTIEVNKQLNQDMADMGSSIAQQKIYIKSPHH